MRIGIDIDAKSIQPAALESHCRTLIHSVTRFFDDPDNQAKYISWHLKKYGCTPEEMKKSAKK